MPEFLAVTQLILKHLPPSAGAPNVYACDERSRRWVMALEQQGQITANEQQTIDAVLASDMSFIAEAVQRLRPNGRAIFIVPNTMAVSNENVVQALTSAGMVRILTESVLAGAYFLARGERPTEQPRPVDRIAMMAGAPSGAVEPIAPEQVAEQYRALHLLVQQDPPTRGWEKDVKLTWHASTVRDARTDRVVLLGFTSLPQAVAFMQPAVLAGVIQNINKLPRFELMHLIQWGLPVIVNPPFEALQADPRFTWEAPTLEIEPSAALNSHE